MNPNSIVSTTRSRFSPWLEKTCADPVISMVRHRMLSNHALDPLPFNIQVHAFLIGQLVDSPEDLLQWCSENNQWPLYDKIIERQASLWSNRECEFATDPETLRELRDNWPKQASTTTHRETVEAPRLGENVKRERIKDTLEMQGTPLPVRLKQLADKASSLSIQDKWLLDAFYLCQTREDLDAFIALCEASPQANTIGHFLFKLALSTGDVPRFAEAMKRFPIIHLNVHLADLDAPAMALEALGANDMEFSLTIELGKQLSTLVAPLTQLTERPKCGLHGVTLRTSHSECSPFAVKPLAAALNRCGELSTLEIINAVGHASSVKAVDDIWECLYLAPPTAPAMRIVKIYGPLGSKTQKSLWKKLAMFNDYGLVLGQQDSFETLPQLLRDMKSLRLSHKPCLFAYETSFASTWISVLKRIAALPVPRQRAEGKYVELNFDSYVSHSDYLSESKQLPESPKVATRSPEMDQLLNQALSQSLRSARAAALQELQSALANFPPMGFQFSLDLFLPVDPDKLPRYFSPNKTLDAIFNDIVESRSELLVPIGTSSIVKPNDHMQVHCVNILKGGSTVAFVQEQQSAKNWLPPYTVEQLQKMLKPHVPYEDLRRLDLCIGPAALREKV